MAEKVWEELTGRMDALVKAFLVVGQQLKEMQDVVTKTGIDLETVKTEQKAQGDRVSKLEEEREQDRKHISMLEDRLRRPNLRLRGFKADFADSRNMIPNIQQWLKENKIEVLDHEIERAHWVFGARRDPNQRDIVIKFLSERMAETVYKELRKITNLISKGAPIRVLKDLSVSTLQLRSQMRPITEALFKGNMRFSWQHPATVVVFYEGRWHRAKTFQEGKEMLAKLGLNPDLKQQAGKVTEVLEEGGAAGEGGSKDSMELLQLTLFGKQALLEKEKEALESSKMEARVTRQKKK